MPRLFALDENFPEPIVDSLTPFLVEAELVPLDRIDPRLSEMDDWELILSLHHHERAWDGLITTDSSMLKQPREMAAIRQTSLTVVVARAAGHDPILATGLVLAHLGWVCAHTTPTKPQVWELATINKAAKDPWTLLEAIANHQNRAIGDVWAEARLTTTELRQDPLRG